MFWSHDFTEYAHYDLEKFQRDSDIYTKIL
jgi:hypothetical protein